MAEDSGGGDANMNRNAIGSWETWVLNNHSDANGCLESGDQIFLTVDAHDLRLQAHSSGDARTIENWGTYERHEITFLD